MFKLLSAIFSTLGCLFMAVLLFVVVAAGLGAWIHIFQSVGGEFK